MIMGSISRKDTCTGTFDLENQFDINNWIREIVNGKTFADLGGLWNTVGEKISVAALAGASEYTMMDMSSFESEWWPKFRTRLDEHGVSGAKEKVLDVMDFDAVKCVKPVDVLYCSGVIYHIPNYFKFMRNIGKLTNDYLILVSMIIPELISNAAGAINTESSGILPHLGLSRTQKKIIETHFEGSWAEEVRIVNTDDHLLIDPKDDESFNNYGPWWWFFTARYLNNLLLDFGWDIIEHKCNWQGKRYAFLCRKKKVTK